MRNRNNKQEAQEYVSKLECAKKAGHNPMLQSAFLLQAADRWAAMTVEGRSEAISLRVKLGV